MTASVILVLKINYFFTIMGKIGTNNLNILKPKFF